MKKLFPLLVLVLTAACSGGDSSSVPTASSSVPTAPSVPTSPPAATRIIELTGNLAFGNVSVSQTRDATLTIRNVGNSTLTFTGFSASPAECTSVFAVSQTSGTVNVASSTAITISFTPAAVQSYTCTVAVISDATSGTGSLAMSGAGVSGSSASSTTFYVWGGPGYGVYLGNFSCTFCKEFGSESINNEFGTYGSRFSASSIRNEFGNYGSRFSSFSPCNEFTSTPPRVYNANKSVSYGALTINQFAPDYNASLRSWLIGDVCNH